MKKLILFGAILLSVYSAQAQFNTQAWRGKKCAVAITYDDALNVHLDHALPLLDSLGLKATFYLTTYTPAFKNRMFEWKAVAAEGHELGNHTLFHPCLGGTPGRSWVRPEYDMSTYTIRRMSDEIRMTNVMLEAIDGLKKRTFAYTCGDMMVSDGSFVEQIKPDFNGARAVRH
ncbi:MAG: polysaccharide deacetylase family protein, partial [Saprospiraceae bacterium]